MNAPNTRLVKIVTGIVLLISSTFQIFTSVTVGKQLNIISFGLVCIAIVLIGFTIAALCEWFNNRNHVESITKVVIKQLIEGVFVSVIIFIICFTIYMI